MASQQQQVRIITYFWL